MIKLNSNINYLWIKGVFYYSITLAILLLIARVSHFQAQLLSVCILTIYMFASRGHTYSFIVKDNRIEVRNRLRPYYKKSYAFDDIKDIEVKGVAYRGLTLVIIPNHHSKKYFAVTRIKKEELQVIMDEFENYKKKKKDI